MVIPVVAEDPYSTLRATDALADGLVRLLDLWGYNRDRDVESIPEGRCYCMRLDVGH